MYMFVDVVCVYVRLCGVDSYALVRHVRFPSSSVQRLRHENTYTVACVSLLVDVCERMRMRAQHISIIIIFSDIIFH